jgi:hypothetical protein
MQAVHETQNKLHSATLQCEQPEKRIKKVQTKLFHRPANACHTSYTFFLHKESRLSRRPLALNFLHPNAVTCSYIQTQDQNLAEMAELAELGPNLKNGLHVCVYRLLASKVGTTSVLLVLTAK